jgi:lipopolysaccharide export system permease protein
VKRAVLDRYLLREWLRILLITALGLPLLVIAFQLTDALDDHLARGVPPKDIALGYAFSLPDQVFQVLPAAVLLATVFSLGAMSRHSELTAAKASGRSTRRTVAPVLVAAVLTSLATLAVGEWAPVATTRQLELLRERGTRPTAARYAFVYRADGGWVYAVRALDFQQQTMRDLVLEREGTGAAYPTLVVEAPSARYNDSTRRWVLARPRFRVVAGLQDAATFGFDSLVQRSITQTPSDLLVEPKQPKEMRYGELGRYIDDLERSGGDGRRLRVRQALKIAIPFTCLIIALFAAPLAVTAPKASGASGIAISLVTTVVFLILVQLSEQIGAGGLVPPVLAAWVPNILFGAVGLVLLLYAPT